MRKRLLVDGVYYKPVPWLFESECQGCYFDEHGKCPNGVLGAAPSQCDPGGEFDGSIFIELGKDAMAAYVARLLERS